MSPHPDTPEQGALIPVTRAQAAAVARRDEAATPQPRSEKRTPEGDGAKELVGAWCDWVKAGSGVSIPPGVIPRIGKQIKGLIAADYSSAAIKYGLAVWTMYHFDNPMLSPTKLDDFTWKYATDTSTQAAAWRNQIKQRIATFSGDAKAVREDSTRDAAQRYIERRSRR